MAQGFIITGTDTGVGKTVAAAGLAGALGAYYWKPIQAGLDGESDSDAVRRLAGPRLKGVIPERYRLATPCSPHEAARLDGCSISLFRLRVPFVDARIIIEGAGGLMVPINDDQLMIDLFKSWRLPVVLVARTSLGTINHSLLSIEALRSSGLEIAGVLFVGTPRTASEKAIIDFGKVRHLGHLPRLGPLNPESLSTAVEDHVRLDLLP